MSSFGVTHVACLRLTRFFALIRTSSRSLPARLQFLKRSIADLLACLFPLSGDADHTLSVDQVDALGFLVRGGPTLVSVVRVSRWPSPNGADL